VLPGLTGADSIAYTYEEIILQRQDDPVKFYDEKLFPDKVRINKAYVRKRNLLLDIKIMAFTLLGRQLEDPDFQPKFDIEKKEERNTDNTDATDFHR
jgi:lipopolysaccharide/colanic/teichoic acid biosynthesis glycosyltransferase